MSQPAKATADTKKGARRRRTPDRFGRRGQRLWDAHKDEVVGERGLVLLEEACRIADRLDKLDGLLKGNASAWASLMPDLLDEQVLVLQVGGALVEARQQANVLRQVIAALPLREAPDDPDGEGGWVADV